MKYVMFRNKGLLDPRLISLMGGSTKRGDEFKIGKFGSGLKYALAYLVRNNVDFKIFVGTKEIAITTKKENIQNMDFDVLYIDAERSSISSSMGLDWVGWMVVRELHANALDEGGYERAMTTELTGKDESTTFYVQNVGEIKETIDNWNNYFLDGVKPLYENKKYAVYPACDTLSIFKQGVLIHRDEKNKSLFSYDFKDAQINELREYKGYLTYDINNCIRLFDKQMAEHFLSNLNEKHFEHDMDYSYWGEFGNEWKKAIGGAKIIAKEDLKSLQERGVPIDTAKMIALPKSLFSKLAERFEGISAVRRAEKVSAFYETFDSELELKIKSALSILESCNYEIRPDVNFIYGEFGDKRVFAQISQDKKEILFSTELKRMSMFETITTIVEETEHLVTGLEDCSRDFQQHFINLFVREMLKRNQVQL